jgi:hypothetical protein
MLYNMEFEALIVLENLDKIKIGLAALEMIFRYLLFKLRT